MNATKTPSEGKHDWSSYKACRPEKPLLLIYLIDALSSPASSKKNNADEKKRNRTALDAVSDLVGFGIVFPGQKDRSGNYFSVDIDSQSIEDTEAGNDELEEIEPEDANV